MYEQLCRSARDKPEPRLDLALVNRKLGDFSAAMENCRQALALAPGNALAHHLQGSIRHSTGDLDGAIASYQAAATLDPAYAETHYLLGNAFQTVGRLDDAAASYRRAIELKPGYLEAMGNLGATLLALHRLAESEEVLAAVNTRHPGHPQILCNLGDLYMLQEHFDMAIAHASKALEINPHFFDAHYLLGRIHRHRHDFDVALENFRKALEIRPGNENVAGSIAELLEIRGEFDAALRLLQPLLDKGSSNPLVLKAYSALSRHFGNERQAIHRLEQALAEGRLDTSRQIRLHSELGKQYDHLHEYPAAFEHYSAANRLERVLNAHLLKTAPLRFTGKAAVQAWAERHGRDFWQGLPPSGNDSARPVFVVGMPRSGTTLAEQILSSHPAVYGAGELPDIDDIARALGSGKADSHPLQYLERLDTKELSAAAVRYLDTLALRSADAQRVVDKMPTNFWHLGLIARLFPNGRVIHMQRDPRDVCLSIYFQRFGSSMTFTTDLVELADYYLAYTAIMDYWKSVLDIPIMDVRYEELVARPEQVIRSMITFCGLEWDERCLSFHETGRDVHTPSYDQVRKPMYRQSAGRWKNYAAQLVPLARALNLDH